MTTRKADPTSWRTSPLPKGWKTTRQRVLARDGRRCTWGGGLPDGLLYGRPALDYPARCPAGATDVDHIGDPDDHAESNLRALCHDHHATRTAGQAAAARWSRPESRRQRPVRRHPGLR